MGADGAGYMGAWEHETAVVADDHTVSRRVISAMLHREGFEVLEVDNVDDAMTLCRSRRVRLLVAELSLPQIEKAGSDPKSGPSVLFVSAEPLQDDRVRSLSTPRVGFLEKPFSAPLFSDAIHRVLDA
jgi:CheY-like chemotaxis protein